MQFALNKRPAGARFLLVVAERVLVPALLPLTREDDMYWVSRYRLTGESMADIEGFWRWLKGWDRAWFKAQEELLGRPGFPFQSSAYYINLSGDPYLEVWMQAENFDALEEARGLSKALAERAEWQQRVAEFGRYLEFIDSRLVDDVPLYKK